MSRWNSGALIMAAGVAIGLIAVSPVGKATAPSVQRAQDLSGTVAVLEQENASLLARVSELNERLRAYEASQNDLGAMQEQVAESLRLARMEAGLVELYGPGLVVTIDNLVLSATGQVVKTVQDEDLLAIVNELNAAGAEAVSINGERVVSVTEIRTAGNFINVNTRSQAPPFRIHAIGDPETLSAAMHLHGGIIDTFSQIARIEAYTAEALTIPAYRGAISFRFAQAAGE